jgi:hypothetical protein
MSTRRTKISKDDIKKNFIELDNKIHHNANASTGYTTIYQYSGMFRYQEMVFRINFNRNNCSTGGNDKFVEQLTSKEGWVTLAHNRDINYISIDNCGKLDGHQKTCESFIEESKKYIIMMYPLTLKEI